MPRTLRLKKGEWLRDLGDSCHLASHSTAPFAGQLAQRLRTAMAFRVGRVVGSRVLELSNLRLEDVAELDEGPRRGRPTRCSLVVDISVASASHRRRRVRRAPREGVRAGSPHLRQRASVTAALSQTSLLRSSGVPVGQPSALFGLSLTVRLSSSGRLRLQEAVDLDAGVEIGESRQLKAASLEPLREDAPARAIEPEHLGQAAALVEKEGEVTVDGVETKATNGTSERIEATAHVERLDGDEDAKGGGEAQHDLSSPTRRRSDCSSKPSPTSSSWALRRNGPRSLCKTDPSSVARSAALVKVAPAT